MEAFELFLALFSKLSVLPKKKKKIFIVFASSHSILALLPTQILVEAYILFLAFVVFQALSITNAKTNG